MEHEFKRKSLKELNLTSRFLFDAVMEDKEIHQDVLSIIFGRKISTIIQNETEKEARLSPLIRSIRMDVFALDDEQTVYNTEMQDEQRSDLARRSRYYQALLDTSLLKPGIPNYNVLNNSYIIVILSFDLFGYGKYQYTFLPQCQEVPGLQLEDGATRIFLSTEGKNGDEVSEELVEFLHYVKNSTDEVAAKSQSERVRRLHQRVCKVKASEEVGVRYMQAWEERYYDREKGRSEGKLEGKLEDALNMRKEGLSDEMIMRITKLTEEEMRKITE